MPIVSMVQQTITKDDPRMTKASMIAAYPDPIDREYAISLLPPVAKGSSTQSSAMPQKSSEVKSIINKASAAKPVMPPTRCVPHGNSTPRSTRADRPRRPPMQLTDQPFWQPPAPIANTSCFTKDCDSPTSNVAMTQRKSVAGDTIKQSSKGYLQVW